MKSIISTSVNLERELSGPSGMVAVERRVYEEVEAFRMAGYLKENTKILKELATGKSL